jgi:hypothetical protein
VGEHVRGTARMAVAHFINHRRGERRFLVSSFKLKDSGGVLGLDFFLGVFEGEAEGGECSLGGAVGLAEEAEEEVFGANAFGVAGFGFFDSKVNDLLEVGSAAELSQDEGFLFVVAVDGFELFFDVVEGDFGVFEDLGGDAFVMLEDGEEDVLGADVLLAVSLGDGFRDFQDVFGGF